MEKVIFIDIPKCATTSIYKMLGDRTWDFENCYKHKHQPLSAYPAQARENYYKITCVRNPYDRMVSIWKYYNKIIHTWFEKDRETPTAKNDAHRTNAINYLKKVKTFKDFVSDCYNLSEKFCVNDQDGILDILNKGQVAYRYANYFPYNDVFLKSMSVMIFGSGTPIDCILRYENIDNDWENLCVAKKWPVTKLPKINVSEEKHWSLYYDTEVIEMVNKIFHWDFINCNYEMK